MADAWRTFDSTGQEVHPIRNQLIEKARQEAGEDWTEYVLIDLDGNTHGSNGNDHRDHSFMARSQVEAVVCLLDYFNTHCPSPTGYDNYDYLPDGYADGRIIDVLTGLAVASVEADNFSRYFHTTDEDPGIWLHEIRSGREAHGVPELANTQKHAGKTG